MLIKCVRFDGAWMNIKNIVREASAALKRNWVRSVLTILGISVGVGAFICVVAIGNARSSSIEKQLQNLGDNFIWIEAVTHPRSFLRYGAPVGPNCLYRAVAAVRGSGPLLKTQVADPAATGQGLFRSANSMTPV